MNAPNIYKLKLSTKIAFGLLLLTAMVNGCASSSDTGSGKARPSLGADFAMPAPGKSKVIFLRPGHYGWAVHFDMHDGDRLIGKSSSSSYFPYECDPGHHVFSTSMETLAFLDADLLPDRIYYVRVRCVMGVLTAEVKMYALYPGNTEINWQEMPQILTKLERENVTSEEVQHDATGAQHYMERLKKYQDESRNGGRILPEYGQPTSLFSQ